MQWYIDVDIYLLSCHLSFDSQNAVSHYQCILHMWHAASSWEFKCDLTIDQKLLIPDVKVGLIPFNGKLSLMQCRKFRIEGFESGCLYPVVLIWDTP